MASADNSPKMQTTLGLTGLTMNAMALIAPGAFLWLTFLIQATTGVTLAGVQSLFPGRPAFAFGLPCIALLAGAEPFLRQHPPSATSPGLVVAIGFLAAVAAFTALTSDRRRRPECPREEPSLS